MITCRRTHTDCYTSHDKPILSGEGEFLQISWCLAYPHTKLVNMG